MAFSFYYFPVFHNICTSYKCTLFWQDMQFYNKIRYSSYHGYWIHTQINMIKKHGYYVKLYVSGSQGPWEICGLDVWGQRSGVTDLIQIGQTVGVLTQSLVLPSETVPGCYSSELFQIHNIQGTTKNTGKQLETWGILNITIRYID